MQSRGIEVSLILPCFNEMEHIQTSLKKISDYMAFVFPMSRYEILLIDDASTDGTRDWLKNLEWPNCKVSLNETNLGRGGAVKQGMKLSQGSVVGFMDIDCEVSESYLSKFVQEVKGGADLSVGRRVYHLSLRPYILLRHFLSQCYKALLRYAFECKTLDSEVGYKFFSRQLVDYILAQSQFDDWFWDTEVILLSERMNFNIIEIPVLFLRNPRKTSTVKVFRDSMNYLKAFSKYKNLMKKGAYGKPKKSSTQTKASAAA